MTLVFLMVCAAPIFAFPWPYVKVEVVPGNPNKDCAEDGICKIIITVGLGPHTGKNAIAHFDDNGDLTMDFMLDENKGILDDAHFSAEDYIIEVPTTLPKTMMIGLGLKDAKGIIKPGKYPIEHQGDRLSINFGNILN